VHVLVNASSCDSTICSSNFFTSSRKLGAVVGFIHLGKRFFLSWIAGQTSQVFARPWLACVALYACNQIIIFDKTLAARV